MQSPLVENSADCRGFPSAWWTWRDLRSAPTSDTSRTFPQFLATWSRTEAAAPRPHHRERVRLRVCSPRVVRWREAVCGGFLGFEIARPQCGIFLQMLDREPLASVRHARRPILVQMRQLGGHPCAKARTCSSRGLVAFQRSCCLLERPLRSLFVLVAALELRWLGFREAPKKGHKTQEPGGSCARAVHTLCQLSTMTNVRWL